MSSTHISRTTEQIDISQIAFAAPTITTTRPLDKQTLQQQQLGSQTIEGSLGQICATIATRTDKTTAGLPLAGLVQGDRLLAGSVGVGCGDFAGFCANQLATVEAGANSRQKIVGTATGVTEPKLGWYRKFVNGASSLDRTSNNNKSVKSKHSNSGIGSHINNNNNNKSFPRASIIANASNSLVDKLTQMIKKSNKTIANSGATEQAPATNATAARQTSLERKRAEGGGGAGRQQLEGPSRASISGNSNNNNNRYLISELGRRLVRRFGKQKPAATTQRGGKLASNGLAAPSERGKPCCAVEEEASAAAAAAVGVSESSLVALNGSLVPGITTTSKGQGSSGKTAALDGAMGSLASHGGGGGSSSMAAAAAQQHGELDTEQPPSSRQSQSGEPPQQSQSQSQSGNHRAQTQTPDRAAPAKTWLSSSSPPPPLPLAIPNQSGLVAATQSNKSNPITSAGNSQNSATPSPSSASNLHERSATTNPISSLKCCGCPSDDTTARVSSTAPDSATSIGYNNSKCSSSSSNNNDSQAPDSSSGQLYCHHHEHQQLTGSPPKLATPTTPANNSKSSSSSSSSCCCRGKLPSFFASTIMMIDTTKAGKQLQVFSPSSPSSPPPPIGQEHPELANLNNNNLGQQARGSGESVKKGSASSTTSSTQSAGSSSFLSRARNSTINLASLATVTHRFNCSASVGNLWSSYGGGGGSQQQKRELADLSGDSSEVKPLDFMQHGQFDHYDPLDESQCSGQAANNNNNNNHNIVKADHQPPSEDTKGAGKGCNKFGGNGLFSIGSAPVSRKSSGKEKKKRQKDAEKVEKLRLLVSYLKSGTSQPLLKPVTLEADEIELAQKYKLHLILCEDCLQQVEVEQQFQQQQQQQLLQRTKPRARLTASASTGSILNSGGGGGSHSPGGSWSPSETSVAAPEMPMASGSGGHLTTIAGIVINVRRSSEQLQLATDTANANASFNNTSSPSLAVPAAAAAASNNLGINNHHHHHHHHNSASSPSIDEQHNSSACSSSTNSDHNLHQHHLMNSDHQDLLRSDFSNHHYPSPTHNPPNPNPNPDQHNHDHQRMDISQHPLPPESQQHQQQQRQQQQQPFHQQQLLCYKCKKPTGRNMSSIISNSSAELTASASVASDIDSNLSTSYNGHEPYTSTTTTTLNAPDAHEQQQQQQQVTPLSSFEHHAANNNNNNNNMTHHNHHLYHNQTPGYNQSTNTTSVLATWIDNEVNSLVNDLEAKSQLVRDEKHAKSSGKRKWLSSSNSSRRNSSGAHST